MMVGSESHRTLQIYIPLAIFMVLLLFPFYWMTIVSLKPSSDLFDMN
ncbi:MAG: carbohydrate ABC transporter permease, partial [Alphaproteobacteria bacterium]|nr:carbohydrate ABC transporter permease [Alphaproteobacteria bacterium]